MSISDGYISDNDQDSVSSIEQSRVQTSSFYKKQKYLTPLERAKLKRPHFEVQSISSSSSTESNSNKKRKITSKSKRSTSKLNSKLPKPKVANGIVNKDINPTVFLSKKDSPPSDGSSNKFFKSRSSNLMREQLRSVLTYKGIVPFDMKAVNAVVKDKKNHVKQVDKPRKVLPPIIHKISSPSPDNNIRVLSMSIPVEHSNWIKNSFFDKSVNGKDNCSDESVCSEPTSDSPYKLTNDAENRRVQMHEEVLENLSEKENSENVYPIFDPKKQKACSPQKKDISKVSTKRSKGCADSQQLMLDAGQRLIGATQCNTCGMLYHIADEVDEELHEKFHECYLTNLNFPGWKKEKVIGKFTDGRIVIITKDDPMFMLRKIGDVMTVVNRDLGIENPSPLSRPDTTYLLFISFDAKVIGCLVAESITSAYPVRLDDKSDAIVPLKTHSNGDVDEVEAICGINRIWVAARERRNRIASRMMDCLRCNFYYGYLITVDKLAFLDPSVLGKKFAASYVDKNNKFLVYK